MPLDGVFVQIGLVPNSEFLGNLVEKTKYGEVVINEKMPNFRGGYLRLWRCHNGTLQADYYRYGEGAKASLSAFEYLLKSGKP